MAGPSSDFNALYQQRIEASSNGQAASFNELMARAVALAEKEVAAMPDGHDNYFFITQWDDDVKISDILQADQGWVRPDGDR